MRHHRKNIRPKLYYLLLCHATRHPGHPGLHTPLRVFVSQLRFQANKHVNECGLFVQVLYFVP